MDYGQDLLFGVFVTPTAQPPMHAVDLAVVADRSGLDLVTFQDHPYQPSFLDTWTLLSFAASRTEQIHLSGNVLNLPLRQPELLARSAATLDRLSGGRLELGIGSGAFWDGIAAMGGERLTPGQAIEALDEAIVGIRDSWSGEQSGGIKPAHDIGIWIGAYKPRMLRLTGRFGDGWLPSLPYLEGGPSALGEMNRHIDEGARSAGREPSEIRRLLNINGQFRSTGDSLLNGPPRQWAEELAGMTLDYGITGFILATDDSYAIELFASEVAPATRELVAAERLAGVR